MWKHFFKIVNIKPGVIIYPRPFGRIDFRSDNLDINLLKNLVEDDRNLPYLVMTDAGIDHFYDDEPDEDTPDIEGNDPSTSSGSEKVQSEALEDYTAKELIKLIKKSEDIIQVRKYSLYTEKFSSVKKAYNKRIEELNLGS
jgi:hypothetical protein